MKFTHNDGLTPKNKVTSLIVEEIKPNDYIYKNPGIMFHAYMGDLRITHPITSPEHLEVIAYTLLKKAAIMKMGEV